jgi:cobalt-zinc-cadmium efflux system outer membrane protein
VRVVQCVACLLLAVCGARAQESLSISEAIRQAWASHPQLEAAAQRIRSAEGLRRQAALKPNPSLTLQSENTRFWGRPSFSFPNQTDDFAYLTQLFETGGKRLRRVEFADAGVQSAEAERALLQRQIAARVSMAYWQAAAGIGLRDLLRQTVENFDSIVDFHKIRVAEGAMAEVDLMRVQLERDRIAVGYRSAEQTALQALIALQREMGRTEFPNIALADRLSDVRDIAIPETVTVLTQRPEMAAARRAVEQARANHRLQQALAKPDPEVSFGYKRTEGLNTLMGIFTIPLPVRNRNEGAIASASSGIRVSESQLRATEAHIRGEVESARAAYEGRRRMLAEVLQPMRERADEIARIATAAYREGGIDLLRLLDAQRARLDALTAWYQALAEYQGSVTTLQIVTGAPL